jgi:hypothetical protein
MAATTAILNFMFVNFAKNGCTNRFNYFWACLGVVLPQAIYFGPDLIFDVQDG